MLASGLPEGTVTILFTDVVGSTELRTGRGDREAHEILRTHDDLVRQQIEANSGQEVKTIGDSFMVAFNSARRAIDCAVGVQQALEEHRRAHPMENVEVRIGLNTGEVIREQEDLFGSAVDAAARIAAKARGGQILVPETLKGILGAAKDIELVDRGRFRLKGFPDRWRLFEVAWREDVSAAPAVSGRTPYVGREAERTELRRRLEDALAGKGSVVMIGGEPGVGKTRIAEELMAEAAERGMLPLIGHCYEQEGSPPYIPFVEMLESASRTVDPDVLREALSDSAPEVAKLLPGLRKLFPDIPYPPELPPEQERRYLFNGMLEYISRAAQVQPILAVFDDLHWADDSTLLLMEQFAQHGREQRLLIIGTYRDVELDVGRPLARMLESLLRQRLAHRISLRRLPEDSVAAMLRALSGQEPPPELVTAIYSETEGNPFFVEEVFQHLSEEGKLFDSQGRWRKDLDVGELDVPEGVRLVVGRRLERVGEECRRALGAAAVIGRRFRYDLVEAVGEVDPDALLDAIDEAERAQLIIAEEESQEAWFTFAHELIRQTLLSAMSLPRRQRTHLRVAEAMERRFGSNADEHVADLAHHLFQAGAAADTAKTARYLVLAGDNSMAAAAFEDALRLYDDAAQVLPPDDAKALADLQYKRGLALRSVGRWEEAVAALQEAAASYESLGAVEELGQVSFMLGYMLAWIGRPDEGVAAARKGLDSVSDRHSVLGCSLLMSVGATASTTRDYNTPGSLLPEAIAIAEELEDEQLLSRALTYRAISHLNFTEYPDQIEAGTRAIALARSANAPWELAEALFMTQLGLAFTSRFDEVTELESELLPLAERVGHLGALLCMGRSRAVVDWCRTGDFAAFRAFSEKDEELCKRAGMPWTSHSYSWRGLSHLWAGDIETGLEHFERAIEDDPPDAWRGGDYGMFAMALAYAGERDRALSMCREGLALERPDHPLPVGHLLRLLCHVETLAFLGEREDAASLYPLALGATGRMALRPLDLQPIHITAGIAAAAGAYWEEAEEHLEAALRQSEDLPIVIGRPEARRWYAQMLLWRDAPGDRDRARELLSEAIAMYRDLSMPLYATLAEKLLAEL